MFVWGFNWLQNIPGVLGWSGIVVNGGASPLPPSFLPLPPSSSSGVCVCIAKMLLYLSPEIVSKWLVFDILWKRDV